jgi:hypothetical protein
MRPESPSRVLSIYPITRGFAYCVFNGAGQLFDWGIKHIKPGEKNSQCLAAIEHLIIRFDPHALVLEDWEETGGRRVARVKHLYREIEKLAERASLDCYVYPWKVAFDVCREGDPKTRHDLAIQVAKMVPAIASRLPPRRKIWLPQDPRQALWTCNGFVPVTYLIMPPWLRMRAG